MKLLSQGLVSVVALALSLASCTKPSREIDTGSSLAARGGVSAGADQVKSCHGNEPFWDLQISKEKIEFSPVGSPEAGKMTISNTGAKAAQGSTSAYVSLYQGRTLENASTFMNVIIQKATCTDGMSDNIYAYTVYLLSGQNLYRGCCK